MYTFLKTVPVSYKLNIEVFYHSAILLLGIYTKEIEICSEKGFYKNVYSSITKSNWHVWKKLMSIHRKMDKKLLV